MEWQHGEFRLSDDSAELDLDVICALLATSYWAADRPREVIERSLAGSLCVGLYRQGRQVGFARAVSDYATFAWIGDVIIHPEHRAAGLGKWMVKTLFDHPRLQVRQQVLATRDAHGLYERFGFIRVEYMRRLLGAPVAAASAS